MTNVEFFSSYKAKQPQVPSSNIYKYIYVSLSLSLAPSV